MSKKILISLMLLISIISMIFNSVYATDENTNNADLPTSYDLRNDINIRVENQGQRGWCNAYAQTKIIETYLQKTKGINYNLSEAYMAYSNVKYFGGIDDWKTSSEVNEIAVYYEGGRIALETDFPIKDYDFTEINKQKFDNAKAVIKSTKNKCLGSSEEIKKYIVNYGAVSTLAYSGDSKANHEWNNTTGAICCADNSNTKDIDNEHAVVIIGWNDNYSRNNFKSNNRPDNDGAWLILNSWGKNWGNNGTAWVSYEDAYVGKDGAVGIEKITLAEELNAEFSYNYDVMDNIITATIITDDKIEDIEGWICDENQRSHIQNKSIYNKKFEESFEPYTIELKSKTDGARTTLEVNIPKEEFEKIKSRNEQEEQKRKKQFEHEKQVAISSVFIMVVFIICIIIFIILMHTLISSTFKKKNVTENKNKPKSLKHKMIIVGLILIVLVILFML